MSGAQLLLSPAFCSSCPVRSGSFLASSSDLQTRSQVQLLLLSALRFMNQVVISTENVPGLSEVLFVVKNLVLS